MSLSAKKMALCGLAGKIGVKNPSTSAVCTSISFLFIWNNSKLAPDKHPDTNLLISVKFCALTVQTYKKLCLFISKITLLALLCAHCHILQEMFSLFVSVYGKNRNFHRKRKKEERTGFFFLCQHYDINSACHFTQQ